MSMKRPSSNPSSGNNNKGQQHYSSYQQGVYYAESQTKTLQDTTKTYHQADETATNVLHHMTAQRQQLHGANDNVWEMRQATEKAKREMEELRAKYRRKKNRLYAMIAALAFTDFLLLLRIIHCHGNFYCI